MTSKYDELFELLSATANSPDFNLRARVDNNEVVLVMDDIVKGLYPTIQKFVADQMRDTKAKPPPQVRKVRLRDRLEAAYRAGWKDCLGAGLGDNPVDVDSAFRLWASEEREQIQEKAQKESEKEDALLEEGFIAGWNARNGEHPKNFDARKQKFNRFLKAKRSGG